MTEKEQIKADLGAYLAEISANSYLSRSHETYRELCDKHGSQRIVKTLATVFARDPNATTVELHEIAPSIPNY